jgi:hypothetical protein
VLRGLGVFLLASLAFVARARADETPEPPEKPAPTEPTRDEPTTSGDDEHDEGDHVHEDAQFGPVLVIEAIEISGNAATQPGIIRRALPVAEGDAVHASDPRLREIRYKVLALGFFRDVTLEMRKGSARGRVVIRIHVVERGTLVLNRLWFGTNSLSPYWFGADVGDRNLIGLGITLGGGIVVASHGDVAGARDQWAGELRAAQGSIAGSRWGASGALTLVHGSEVFRVAGEPTDTSNSNFNAFPYRRFGGRWSATYDASALSRLQATLRAEEIDAQLPAVPTQTLPDGRVVPVDLSLKPGGSTVVTLGFGFDRDSRPDPILPHVGDRVSASFELGTRAFGSSYDFATLFARYEHWWPILRDGRHAIGLKLAGGIVVGDAPRFDRIHISDVDRMLTPRALGMVLSDAGPLALLRTRSDKPDYGDLGGSAIVEYAARLWRGGGSGRVYGGDVFVGAGLWGLAANDDLRARDTGLWHSLPIDLYADAGVRIDTDIGVFELTIANALGRLR